MGAAPAVVQSKNIDATQRNFGSWMDYGRALKRILRGTPALAAAVRTDEVFASHQHHVVTKIELWASVHMFLVTEDEAGRRLAHHFFDQGYEGSQFGDANPESRLVIRLTREVTNGVTASEIKSAMASAGPYRMINNNCTHAGTRGLVAAGAVDRMPSVLLVQAAVVAQFFLMCGGGALAIAAYSLCKRSANDIHVEVEAEQFCAM